MQDHRRLDVWARARAAALAVDALTQRFQRRGYGWLATQLRKASESVPSNIVEGCGQATGPEFARYLQSALASAGETAQHLDHGAAAGVIPTRDARQLEDEYRQLQRMLTSLIRQVRTNFRDGPRPPPDTDN
jgi:four helix bundle protein